MAIAWRSLLAPLVDAGTPLLGLGSYEAMRVRIAIRNEFPHVIVGKRYFVSKLAILRRISEQQSGSSSEPDGPSEDLRLIRFFKESEEHDDYAAVEAGITKTLAKASYVYEGWKARRQNNPAIAAKLLEEEQTKRAENEPPCETCERKYHVARGDSMKLVGLVTGKDPNPNAVVFVKTETIDENEALSTFIKGWKCHGCGMWRADAPITAMREALITAQYEATKTKAVVTDEVT